jgi:geranylgeranyl reductase family protein
VDTDVIIVGAGPAGSTAARLCASAGLDTVIVDRATFPREKPCGGLLSVRAAAGVARIFGLGAEPDPPLGAARSGLATHFHRIGRDARWRDYRYLAAEAGRPLGYVTRRTVLDARLLDLAAKTGARLFCGTEVVAWGQDEEGVWVSVREAVGSPASPRPVLLRTLRARYLVGADGAASVVARGFGVGSIARGAAGVRRPGFAAETFSLFVPLPSTEVEKLTAGNLAFHVGLLRGGFGWAFPAADGLAVGVGAMARPARAGRPALLEVLQRLLSFYGLNLASSDLPAPRAWWVPLGGRRRPWEEGRVLLVGDAAGVADPATGEGLGPAIRSAEAAAGLIIRRVAGRVRAAPFGRQRLGERDKEARAAAVGVGAAAAVGVGAAAVGAAAATGQYGRLLWDREVGLQRRRLLAATALGRISAGGQGRLFRRAVLRFLRDGMMTGGPGV